MGRSVVAERTAAAGIAKGVPVGYWETQVLDALAASKDVRAIYALRCILVERDKLLADIQAALGAEWSRTDSSKLQTRRATFRSSGRYRMTEVTVTPPTRLEPACILAISILQGVDSSRK